MFVKGPEANLHSVIFFFLNTCMYVCIYSFFSRNTMQIKIQKEFLRLCKQVALKLRVNSLFHCK